MAFTSDSWVAYVRACWGESTGGPITDQNILDWGNEAQITLCLKGQILLSCTKSTTVASQETYNVPGDYLKIECVFWSSRTDPLQPMEVGDRNGSGKQGTPWGFYMWGENVNGLNSMVVGLQDVPAVNGVANDLEIFLRRKPAVMALGTPGPQVNPEVDLHWQYAMKDYALMMIYGRLRDTRFVDHAALWKDWIGEAKNYVNPLQNGRPIPRRDSMMLDALGELN